MAANVFPTETVTDWTFYFLGGDKLALTLKENEHLVEAIDRLQVPYGDEFITIERRNLLFSSRRDRIITIYPAGESPLELAVAEMAALRNAEQPTNRKHTT